MYEKNPPNSEMKECSGDLIRITNRVRKLPKTFPNIHLPNQLPVSSEIGPFEDGSPSILLMVLRTIWGPRGMGGAAGTELQMDLSSSSLVGCSVLAGRCAHFYLADL